MTVGSPYASALPPVEPAGPMGVLVNDLHSQLNPTRVARIVQPATVEALRAAIAEARGEGRSVSIAGGRHAMGGQQFGEANVLIDTRQLNRILAFDADNGVISAQGGVQWPELIQFLNDANAGARRQWGIFQKQTGADRLSLAGALACNAHGRGLTLKPIIDQVRAFDLVDANGTVRTCSERRTASCSSWSSAATACSGGQPRRTQLRPRVKVRRVVELEATRNIPERFDERIQAAFLYGDFQYATDSGRDSFLRRGVLVLPARPDDDTADGESHALQSEDWARLTFYAHSTKAGRSRSIPNVMWRRRARCTGPTRSCLPRTSTTTTATSMPR